MKKIAITFPIFNGLDFTKKCLQRIYDLISESPSIHDTIRVIITDDGSTDGSSEWIKNNFPDVILQYGDGNLWWSGGINKAVDYILAHNDIGYMLLWNSDVIAGDNYFSNLVKISTEIDNNTIILSKVYFLDKPEILISMGGVFNPKNGKYFLRGYGEKDSNKYSEILPADWFGGMGTLIHRDILQKVGHFDAVNFPQYHGDSDFGLRAKKMGIKLFVRPDLKIYNDKTFTGYSNNSSLKVFIRSLYSLKSNHNIKKEIAFYRKHATSPLAYMQICKHYFRHIGGFIKWKILNIFGKQRKL